MKKDYKRLAEREQLTADNIYVINHSDKILLRMIETLVLKNDISEIDRLKEALVSFREKHALPVSAIHDTTFALEEIVSNTILYGFSDTEEHQIKVTIKLDNQVLEFQVEDDGIPFNPLVVQEPDLEKPFEDREVGGLGIFFVKKLLTDDSEYRYENGLNVLTIKKNISTE